MEWFIHRVNNRRPDRFLILESYSQHIREKEMIRWENADDEIKEDVLKRAHEWNRQENDDLIERLCKVIFFMNQVFDKYYE